ncbi:hypothetical protein MIND_01019700 [Mycena indigotica]|uniref:Uncharacterized protein n=1 Tax=Mycena indigotica TaxID=2126181 RepID=A0A8H6S9I7_9AGAR|nr:uncharacterized protein MIND_01019700 [Mycena indigotica]KAF7294818.1 hypothetical protein MIND_01019700 [Mycena indigotica]
MNTSNLELYDIPAWKLVLRIEAYTKKITACEADMERDDLTAEERETAERNCAEWYRERAQLQEVCDVVLEREDLKYFDPPPTPWVTKFLERWFLFGSKDKTV